MAGFTAKKTKNGTTYIYKGELRDCLEKAQKELETKQESSELLFLIWQHDRAKKELDRYNKRINDLESFISCAKKELGESQ